MPSDTLSPVVGDPLKVLAAGRTMSSIAAEIADTASRLRALAKANNTSDAVTWTGQAAVKAYARTISLPPKLDKAQASYAEAGGALTTYAGQLAQAQADSVAAVRAAATAEAELDHAVAAKAAAAAADAQEAAAAVAAGLPLSAPTAPRYEATIQSARVQLDRARAANSAAHEEQTAAARRAAAALKHASRDGIANKHWWQKAVSNATHWADVAWTSSLRFVTTYAAQISAITGMIALVLSVAGLIFPPLELAAAVFETAALIFGALAAISDLALALSGNGSWTNVGRDALTLLPAGAGKITRKLAPTLRETKAVRAVAGRLDTASVNRWPPRDAKRLIPTTWGTGRPGRKGVSWRWDDPKDAGNRIRVDRGDPTSTQPSQRVHHVVVGRRGVIVGRDGKPLPGRLKDFPELGHVPLEEWLRWRHWSNP